MGLFTSNNQSAYGGKKGPNKIVVYVIAGVVGIIVISVLIMIIGLVTGAGKQDLVTSSARMTNLQTLLKDARTKLRNADVIKLNSDSLVLVTSDIAAINSSLASKYDVKNLNKETLAKETNSADTKALSEAELVNNYDITYRQIIRKNIATTLSALLNAKNNNSDTQTTKALQTATANLNSIDKRLSELNLQ